ncbi:MAG: hypothetical protein M1813_008995 [Trichoglossum hirsutum]|nr:MAG: hypothetical protein M1813_008995 [Trichoglossum hirsutum]
MSGGNSRDYYGRGYSDPQRYDQPIWDSATPDQRQPLGTRAPFGLELVRRGATQDRGGPPRFPPEQPPLIGDEQAMYSRTPTQGSGRATHSSSDYSDSYGSSQSYDRLRGQERYDALRSSPSDQSSGYQGYRATMQQLAPRSSGLASGNQDPYGRLPDRFSSQSGLSPDNQGYQPATRQAITRQPEVIHQRRSAGYR